MHTDFESGCILPLAQAVVTAALAGALAWGAVQWANEPTPVYIAFTVGVAAGCAVWIAALRAWRELAYPKPIDFSQPVAAVENEPARVRVEVKREDTGQLQFVDLPASLDQLSALARGLLNGGTLAESQWTGSGAIFTRAQFAALRAELIKRGMAAWNSPGTPARGVTLTRTGQAAMRHFASMAEDHTASPPLSGGKSSS